MFCLVFACSQGGDAGDPDPGDRDYIPPEWTAPDLAYPREAYTPSEVCGYSQAPGQFAGSGSYNIAQNAQSLLGFPSGGGTVQPNAEGIVSLGMAGGYVCVKFDPPVENHPDNIGGYDFIVFGNAYWTGADSSGTWQEPGVIYVMKDENGDGTADDEWYLIPGSHLTSPDVGVTVEYSLTDETVPPPASYKDDWWPYGSSSPSIEYQNVFLLPEEAFAASPPSWGYADITPVLQCGDLSGAERNGDNDNLDGAEDYPGIDPVYFYTVPDSRLTEGVDPGSGGGDAVDIGWAVDPETFAAVQLDEISWIKIVSASTRTGALGDQSPEIDAVTRVRRE